MLQIRTRHQTIPRRCYPADDDESRAAEIQCKFGNQLAERRFDLLSLREVRLFVILRQLVKRWQYRSVISCSRLATPFPVANFRHVLAMLVDELFVLDQLGQKYRL